MSFGPKPLLVFAMRHKSLREALSHTRSASERFLRYSSSNLNLKKPVIERNPSGTAVGGGRGGSTARVVWLIPIFGMPSVGMFMVVMTRGSGGMSTVRFPRVHFTFRSLYSSPSKVKI